MVSQLAASGCVFLSNVGDNPELTAYSGQWIAIPERHKLQAGRNLATIKGFHG
jgi:hypothetical protein